MPDAAAGFTEAPLAPSSLADRAGRGRTFEEAFLDSSLPSPQAVVDPGVAGPREELGKTLSTRTGKSLLVDQGALSADLDDIVSNGLGEGRRSGLPLPSPP